MIVEKLKEHREYILTSFCGAMEFKVFTDLAYIFASEYITTGHETTEKAVIAYSQFASEFGIPDKQTLISDLPAYFASAKEKYFLSMVHQ